MKPPWCAPLLFKLMDAFWSCITVDKHQFVKPIEGMLNPRIYRAGNSRVIICQQGIKRIIGYQYILSF